MESASLLTQSDWQRALTKMDTALDIAKQLVFDLDRELRRRDDGSPKAAAE